MTIKYTLLVPVEITLDSEKQLKVAVRRIKGQGPFPEYSSYGEQCFHWRVRCDKVRVKDAKRVSP